MQTIAARHMTPRKTTAEASPSPFGARLREARVARGLGLRELSRAASVSHTIISLLETGRQEAIEVRAAVALAKALGVTVEWLVTGDGDGPKPASA
jgi:transcriptional regulator with XRE-family HTH domain